MRISSALLVNVGTLSEDWVGGMKLAAIAADRLGKPWVLDPVGCGATPARTKVRTAHMTCRILRRGARCPKRSGATWVDSQIT